MSRIRTLDKDVVKMLEMTETVQDAFVKKMENYDPYKEELFGKPLVKKLQEHIRSVKNYLWMEPRYMKPLVDAIMNEDYNFFKTTTIYSQNFFITSLYKLILSKILYQDVNPEYFIKASNRSIFWFSEYQEISKNIYHLAYPKFFNYIFKSSFWSFDQDPMGIYINHVRESAKWDNGKFCVVGFSWGFLFESLETKKSYYFEGLNGVNLCRYKDLLIMKYKQGTVVVEWPLVKFVNFAVTPSVCRRFDVIDTLNLSQTQPKINLISKCYDIKTNNFIDKKAEVLSENYNLTCVDNYLFLDGEPIIYTAPNSISHNDGKNIYVLDRHGQLVNSKYQNLVY